MNLWMTGGSSTGRNDPGDGLWKGHRSIHIP